VARGTSVQAEGELNLFVIWAVSMSVTLKEEIERLQVVHGGISKAAASLDIDAGYLCRLRDGIKQNPSDEVLKKLKMKRIITFEYI